MTFRNLIENAVRAFPEKTAVRFKRGKEWRSFTFRQFSDRVKAMACFAGNGLKLRPREDKVAFLLENDERWIEFYTALTAVGITVVPMDPKLRTEEVAYILQDSGAVAVFTDLKHIALLEEILPDLPALGAVIFDEGTESCGLLKVYDYETVLTAAAVDPDKTFYDRNKPIEQDIASIIYTSGTTGKPKGAMLSHNNFCSDAIGCLDHMPMFGSKDNFLVVLPLFHSFSFMANYVVPLTCQAEVSFVENIRTVGEDIKLLRPTVLMAVPLLVDKLYQKIDAKLKASLIARLFLRIGLGRIIGRKVLQTLGGRLSVIIVGGAPCPKHVLHGMTRLGICTVEGYGLTEASPVVSTGQPGQAKIGTIGKKLPNIEVRIAAPNEQGVGELQIRGPIVMKGYYNNLEATRASFDGPWLKTGDLASIDKEGFITIRGRSKALIVNREGKNIYPEEVENCIARDPLVGDVVVIGYREGEDPGEKVGVIIAPNTDLFKERNGGKPVPPAEMEEALMGIVRKQCRKLAEYKHPRKTVFSLDPLERTSTQKVRRCVYQGTLDTK